MHLLFDPPLNCILVNNGNPPPCPLPVFLSTYAEHGLNYAAVLDNASDIARAMLHLHKANILHLDLKAANVLLKSGTSGADSIVAKVMDFGLSVSMVSVDV